MLHRQARFPGPVSVHPGQVQDRYVARDAQPRAAELLGAGGRRGGHRDRHALRAGGVRTSRSSKMADGRVALIGDAACGARPHAAAGTAKAAADGWALQRRPEQARRRHRGGAAEVGAGAARAAAPRCWSGSSSWANDPSSRNTWTPGDPSLRFGLYGPGRLTNHRNHLRRHHVPTRFLADLPLAGTLVGTDFEGWSRPSSGRSSQTHAHDGHVGSRLLSQTPRARVWEIRLAPGERWHAHRHVLDYFWTAINAGRSRQHTHDGTIREVSYQAGETRYFHFGAG